MDPDSPEIATLAARDGLVRVYRDVLGFVLLRAAAGDAAAMAMERELTLAALPAPTHGQVRSWLATVAGERHGWASGRVDRYQAQALAARLDATEARAGALGPTTWAQVVMAFKAERTGRAAP